MSDYNYHKTKDIILNGKRVSIDIGCIELVQFFNRVGLTTKFSCENQNGRFVIMFSDDIQDKDIEGFIDKTEKHNKNSLQMGSFKKWTRKLNGDIKSNWQNIAKDERESFIDYKNWVRIYK